MFSEIVFKTNLVAVKSTMPFSPEQLVVDIYEPLPGDPLFPEFVLATSRMSRIFNDSSITGTHRHAANWIDKLSRVPVGGAIWSSEREDYASGATGAPRLFVREIVPSSQEEFFRRIGGRRSTPVVSLTPELFRESLNYALIDEEVSGLQRRERIINTFSENLAERLRSP